MIYLKYNYFPFYQSLVGAMGNLNRYEIFCQYSNVDHNECHL